MRTNGSTGAVTAGAGGVLMVLFLAAAGQLQALLVSAVAFAVAIVLAGVVFDLLVAAERLRLGYGPGILYWCVAFPVVRLVQELAAGLSGAATMLERDAAGFLVWQALVGSAFGLGFLLLYQQVLQWRYRHDQ